ncbi:MAG: VOC family protein [Chloroflexia bacterium]|nr:VOC family protein [Chloroflexia bacterium]
MTEPFVYQAKLVPELLVTRLDASLRFWRDLLGFAVAYDRPEEGFAYLHLAGAEIMLEQVDDSHRTWLTGPLNPPFGRGINFQIEVAALDPTLERLRQASWPLFLEPEERWYRMAELEVGQRQFLVQDPDGYLVRLAEHLGERAIAGGS